MRILLYLICGFFLAWCSSSHPSTRREIDATEELHPIYEVVILPHHGITGKNIDAFYADLQKKYRRFDRIVIISPDHFGLEKNPVGSLPKSLSKLCYLSVCIQGEGIDPYASESEVGRIFDATGSTREHGLGEHILRIARYFPEASTSPLLLRRNLFPGIQEQNIEKILSEIPEKRVLVIASVDFSHHVREEFAILHDRVSIDTLRFGAIEDFPKIEVDCRNCLAVAKILAEKKWNNDFDLSLRTSVDSISGSWAGIDNTSHIFGSFVPKKETISGEISSLSGSSVGVFLFAWDSHWARGFPYYEKRAEWYSWRVARILYQSYDTANDLKTKYHRIFSGFDDVIVNFESGLASDAECPRTSKSTQMWTDPKYLPWFRDLGITLANVANNHSHDCGKKVFESSFSTFLSGGITSFWYDRVALRTIRGDTYAFFAIDTIESRPDIEAESKRIKDLTASGYIVIANIHFWTEYATGHSERQAKIAHDFIDAGARLIIGHHPHVVQDIEIYKWVPIYYSLGNFLFDQPFSETLRWLLVGCEVSRSRTDCHEVSVYRNPKDFSLSFSSGSTLLE